MGTKRCYDVIVIGGGCAGVVAAIQAGRAGARTLLVEKRWSLRRQMRLYRFLRQQPGLETLVIEHVAPECGVRETVTIQAKRTVRLCREAALERPNHRGAGAASQRA